jgi:hypothetical protein
VASFYDAGDWQDLGRVAVTEELVERADTLAWEHGLRGYGKPTRGFSGERAADREGCDSGKLLREILHARGQARIADRAGDPLEGRRRPLPAQLVQVAEENGVGS